MFGQHTSWTDLRKAGTRLNMIHNSHKFMSPLVVFYHATLVVSPEGEQTVERSRNTTPICDAVFLSPPPPVHTRLATSFCVCENEGDRSSRSQAQGDVGGARWALSELLIGRQVTHPPTPHFPYCAADTVELKPVVGVFFSR